MLHHHRGFDVSRARFEDYADVLGRFVAHVAQQRRLLLVEQLGQLLDQPRLLHAVGNFGDDGDPAAAPGILLQPARAQPERPASGAIGLRDRGAIVDDDPAGRKIRSRRANASSASEVSVRM